VQLAKAMNAGILLLLSTPYLILAGIGFLFYRLACRARHQQPAGGMQGEEELPGLPASDGSERFSEWK
jgi:hypothetical protein